AEANPSKDELVWGARQRHVNLLPRDGVDGADQGRLPAPVRHTREHLPAIGRAQLLVMTDEGEEVPGRLEFWRASVEPNRLILAEDALRRASRRERERVDVVEPGRVGAVQLEDGDRAPADVVGPCRRR